MKQILILLSILSLFTSCNKDIDESKRVLKLEPFIGIKLEDAFEVFITEGDEYSTEIVGDKKVIEYVDVIIESDTLIIKNTRKAKWTSPRKNKIKIYVNSPPLKKIITADGCNIKTVTPITSEEFGLVLGGKASQAKLELAGNIFYYWNIFPSGGKLTLSGETELLKLWNFAIMSVDAKNLIAKNAIVENNSQGDCEVHVLEKLQYSISEKGNIHLYGKPSKIVSKGESSSGKLIQH